MRFTEQDMITRQAELKEEIKAITDVSVPLRNKLSDIKEKHWKEKADLDEQIKNAENGLFDLRKEESVLARALGGKSLGRVTR